MSVVTMSLFSLKKARKGLEHAYEEGDWLAVKRWDGELASSLNEAFDDEGRDTAALVRELQTILATYARIVDAIPETSTRLMLQPDFRK